MAPGNLPCQSVWSRFQYTGLRKSSASINPAADRREEVAKLIELYCAVAVLSLAGSTEMASGSARCDQRAEAHLVELTLSQCIL